VPDAVGQLRADQLQVGGNHGPVVAI
jgi:hypothetical protein